MKKKLSIAAVLFLSFFSVATFAQDVPGDWGSGGPDGHPKSQPSPVAFKRNNGNGTCGREAEIRLYFKAKPDYMPTIQGILYEGNRINCDINPIDTSLLAKKGYVSYCIGNTNLPPACKLALILNYYQSNQTFLMEENKVSK